jgi:hypothetical protein
MPDIGPLPVPFVVESAGFYADLDELTYHSDPVPGGSLSHTGAKLLLAAPPAKFKEYRDRPEPPKRAFDFGHAAHAKVLGVGLEIVVVDAPDWRTKAAKEQAAEARARGAVPLLADEARVVYEMADALLENDIAAALLQSPGTPELSMFWRDADTDVWCRGRLDWMPAPLPGRLIVPDYKTSVSAHPASFQKSVADYGYHQQADWYLDGLRRLGVADDDAAFVFVVQEKTPPYLVNVFQLDEETMRLGAARNRRARDLYAYHSARGEWPGYEGVQLISLPAWAARQQEAAL